MNSHTFVSVIIPVYNDTGRLLRCLQALEEQSYPQEAYEVIVVDNASHEPVAPLLNGFRQVKAAYEATPGSYAARNAGLALAVGEVLAFTDSDCIPAANWIELGVQALLQHPECGAIGGEVRLFYTNPTAPTSAELYEQIMYFNQRVYIETHHFSVTANLFTFRRIIEAVGPFDATLKSSGDKDWCLRLVSAGYLLFYAASVLVEHPARHDIGELRRKVLRLAGGFEGIAAKRKSLSSDVVPRFSLIDWVPPVLTVLRLGRKVPGVSAATRAGILGIWFSMKALELKERIRVKLGGHTQR